MLDQRTRQLLFALQQKGRIPELDGLINSGKEASVYRAGDYAVKIFATSAMVFKDRQLYIADDRRFAQMSSRSSNSRQLVRLWCEKEFRNLRRVFCARLVRTPEPHFSTGTVLVMQRVAGAVRLSEIGRFLSPARLRKLYFGALRVMRDLYVHSNLVHGDLSEYNILYQTRTRRAFVIDVGQALDVENESALLLLRADIRNVNCFFARLGVETAANVRALEFVTARLDPPAPPAALPPPVLDCYCADERFPVPPLLVHHLRLLRADAAPRAPEEILEDDRFLRARIFCGPKQSEGGAAAQGLQQLGTHA